METWEIVLLIIAAVVAVRSLVRLMQARRDLLVGDFKRQFERHRQREEAAKKAEEEAAA